jgi:tRNA1(Val) A37 N6-methylase TrmN6
MVIKALQLVDFIDTDCQLISGLVPVAKAATLDLKTDEKAAALYADTFKIIDYVFFRRFSDGRSSHISAYIVDNSDEKHDAKALAELHQKIWFYGSAPLLYVFWPSRIDILTCVRGPDFWDSKRDQCQYSPSKTFELQALSTAGEIVSELSNYSALRLADGTFWEEPNNKALANYDKTAHQLLIQAIVETDKAIQTDPSFEEEVKVMLRKLLLLMVLIKYLEDRRVFPDGFFANYHKGATDFIGVLRGCNPQEVDRLLDTLEQKFDGDVFSLPYKDRQVLTSDILNLFANLVDARTLKKQRYLWKQFSFEHLPVEIISNLYQRFVQGGHGAVYTPPLLVSLLLDYVMPYDQLTGKERILDPACGSGIFLVGAFRRLTNLWRASHEWQKPDVKILKGILRQCIYGVEIDSSAIDLTAFSMCLAMCDALQPEVIWKDLKFDKLRERNLVKADFFSILGNNNEGITNFFSDGFDIIIGNPPFESRLSPEAEKIDHIAQKRDLTRGSLPDKQSAYLFLEQSLALLRDEGRVCLIQPSAFLYMSSIRKFRTNLFKKNKVHTIFDFTSIRKLYEAADPKTIAVLAYAIKPTDIHKVNHWTFRRTTSVHERICFEIDHYDQHRVPQELAENDYYVWRVNLLGGGRLLDMSHRLRQLGTLVQYIKQKGWDYGEGFIVGGDKVERTPASFLMHKPLLPTEAFTSSGIDKSKLTTVEEILFRSPYTERRYIPPLMLIKLSESLPIYFWDEGFIAYSSKILGISAPRSETKELGAFYDSFLVNHGFYRFYCALHGTQALIDKATVPHKQDIDSLPYPEDKSELSLSFWEEALCKDTLECMADYVRLGQNSKLLKNAANTNDLQVYSDMFIRMLKSVYDNLHASEPLFMDGLTCQPFYFGKRPDLSWLTKPNDIALRKLIYADDMNKHLRTVRVVRFYSSNYLLLIKPDRLRYWIPSTAIRDADETIINLRSQGY